MSSPVPNRYAEFLEACGLTVGVVDGVWWFINADGEKVHCEDLAIPNDIAIDLFGRTGGIKRIELTVSPAMLFDAVV